MKVAFKHFILIAILTSIALAQVSVGTPPFGSFGGGPFDVVNLGNLNVHFSIPVLHKAGRGIPFSYDLSYDSSIWYQGTVSGTTQWVPTANWGWTSNALAILGYLQPKTTTKSQSIKCSAGFGGITTNTTTYSYVDANARSHPFPGDTVSYSYAGGCSGPAYGPALNALATDGSGWTLYAPANELGVTVTTRSGILVYTNVGTNGGSGKYQDTNGNQLNVNNSTRQYFDTLSATSAVLTTAGSGTPSSPVTYTYVAPSGANAVYQINYTQYTVKTDFSVSGVSEYGPTSDALVSSIQLPDGTEYQFTYEETPGACTPLSGTYPSNCITGRIGAVTLPTGGTITYGYTGGSNGIESDGSTSGLTRALSATTTAPAQSWSYTRALATGTPGPGSTWTTTVVDSNGNNTVINFAEDSTTTNPSATPPTAATYNFYETQRQVYQGSVSSSNLLMTMIHCYNAKYATCATATASSPITQTDAYAELPNGSTRLSEVLYNSYGLMTDDKEYNYGVALGAVPSSTYLVRETATSYGSYGASGCTALTNGIQSKPCRVTVYDWSSGSQVTLASSTYTYDGSVVSTTSGTPQHVSITGSRGNLTTLTTSTSNSASLTKTFTYYDTGSPYVATDVNGAQTTYVYSSGANPYNSSFTASCGNSFATTIDEPLNLIRSMQWNCTGGIAEQVTDENGNNVTSSYSDTDFWRPASVTDQMGNQTTFNYYVSPTSTEATLNFNGSISTSDSRTTLDGFGRIIFNQRLQKQGGSSYDTSEIDYNNMGQPYISRMPYSATASPSSDNTSAPATTTTYDALGRVVKTLDADGGYISYQYTNNDVLQTASGTPSGTQSFEKQFEYDGLGRLTSVCEINLSGNLPNSGTCGQKTTHSGYWTKYTYDALGHLLTVTQNAQATSGSQQTRSFTYDMLGRMTSEMNPESGTTTYHWDTSPDCGSSTGDMVEKIDNSGAESCHWQDSLHRVVTITADHKQSPYACRIFAYDAVSSSAPNESTPPSGATFVNTAGRLLEAWTNSDCNGTANLQTAEWFSYDKDGHLTDVYESTPHSGGFYHSDASYWANGTVKTLTLLNSSASALIPAQTYGMDGEGRPNAVSAASGQNPVTSVTYSTSSTTNYLGALTGVIFGSGDSDAFTYDPNTGRMGANSTTPAYTFTVNGKMDSGTLTWSANGTLTKLVINNTIPNTADSQTCAYGYDDLQRASGVNCGTLWSQNFTYDVFGNIAKSVPSGDSGLSFAATYNTFNQFMTLPGVVPSYDANGNLKTDNLNTYTWDTFGDMLTVTPSGGSTVTATYDAQGRMVENNSGGSYTQFVYGPTGAKLAQCNGQILVKAFVTLPGGAKAIYNSSGLAYYRHSDWLGSSRLTSTASQSLYSSSAYAPFGERYATYPSSGSLDPSFTGKDQDTVANLYDFPARRHSPSQGRWISPDPSGRAAVVLTNPQTWNHYAYVNNSPLHLIDPFGLYAGNYCDLADPGCYGGGPGGGGGGSDDCDMIDASGDCFTLDTSDAYNSDPNAANNGPCSGLTSSGGTVNVPFNNADPTAGNMRFQFDGQGNLTGIAVSLSTVDAATVSVNGGSATVPANTYAGVQWINDDTVQYGFSNPVFTTATGNMFNAYIGQATYSDVGNGSYTSVTGAPSIGTIPMGPTNTYSGFVADAFNNGDNAGTLGSIGNSLVSAMDYLHDNVTCGDLFGGN